MSWTCPNCRRTFRNTNQVHSCESVPEEFHLKRGSEPIRSLYEKLMEKIRELGPFELYANRSEIILRKTSAFLSIHVYKTKLLITFYLEHMDPDPPVMKVMDLSKNRIIHQAEISVPEDLSPRLLFLLAQAYDLIE